MGLLGLKHLTEKWKHPKKLYFPERFTLLEIPVVTTQNQLGNISNGVNIISDRALDSAHHRPVRRVGVLDFKMKSEVTALLRGS